MPPAALALENPTEYGAMMTASADMEFWGKTQNLLTPPVFEPLPLALPACCPVTTSLRLPRLCRRDTIK